MNKKTIQTNSHNPGQCNTNTLFSELLEKQCALLVHDLIEDRLYVSTGGTNWLTNLYPGDGLSLSEWLKTVTEPTRAYFLSAIEQVRKGQTAFVKYSNSLGNGRLHQVQHYMVPLPPNEPVTVALGCVFVDVEAKQDGSGEELPEKILNTMIDAVIVTDPKGIILYWNQAAESLYGYSASEAIGQPVYQITVSEHTQKEAKIIMDILRSGRSWSGEFMVKDRRGRRFLAHVTDTPLLDVDGNLTGIIGISHDATRKAEFWENTIFLADVMRQMHAPIFVTDEDMRIREWSWGLEEVSGWREMEMVDASVTQIFHLDGMDEFLAMVLRNHHSRRTVETTGLLLRKSGDHLEVGLSASRVFDKDHSPIGVLWSVRVPVE